MNRLHTISISAAAVLALAFASCSTAQYRVASVERSRILIDSRYDNSTDPEVVRTNNALLERKKLVDAEMNPVQGHAAENLWVKRPESPLSNLLADILVWGGAKFNEQPDFAVYNMGGIRAALSKGTVTRGNILDVAPFDNKICFLSATINGKTVDPNAKYRVATLDYLAQGNDHMEAFRKKTDVVSPTGEENNVRHIIEQYFKAADAKGEAVSSAVEGRMKIVEK